MNRFLIAGGLAALLSGCGQADKENAVRLEGQVEKLQAEVSSLRAELDQERNGPARSLAKAKDEISQNHFALAKKILSDLISRFPESPQSQEARSLLTQTNANILAAERASQAEAAKAAEEKRKSIARLDANLVKNVDEIKGITWVSHKAVPVLANYMSLYFGLKDGSAESLPLRMKFNYFADDWLFVQTVTIKADDQVFELGKMEFERDHASGSIWEWSDTKAVSREILDKILSAKKVVVRYDGRQYYHDYVLPESQKTAMRETLLAWQRYGGKG